MNNKINKLLELKKQRNAVILAHYYQDPAIQEIADYLGDSLALAQYAQKSNADVILFCGVYFMAETAKILNPGRIVLLPDTKAGCSLADSAPAAQFAKWLSNYPYNFSITYINSTAEVKALSDIICTSSNAEKIINSIPPDKNICFAPDRYLGNYLMKKTGRNMILWDGSCQVHEYFSEMELIRLMQKYPESLFLAHPECPENILNYADFTGSTTAIIKYALESSNKQFIIGTEPGVIYQMQKNAPGKEFFALPNLNGCSCNECPYMRLNTIDKMISALERLEPQINISESLRLRALIPLGKMLELS